ncbi:acetate--CoA ligase family protein [Hydrogenophaga sp. BPS33]|uniref:acetate--CoA ligase family protein n=1 Tax=Hydrogenophaga sp. BPS33 TaxID=2651974 RepID=UPI0013203B43|nr:acetate--CoA ligase family protein [Hydrogenophaga sp. BPS33]QHE84790.1 acetate--CoA ligase family protein [Hydrogenophaga sp. BPS33]
MPRPLYRHADLHRLVHPASIAIVGASNRPGAFGQRVFENLAAYQGKLYPVNSRYSEVAGHTCFASLSELPDSPDLVIIAAPRDEVEAIVDECCRVGAGGAIVYASGFAEMGRPPFVELQARIVEKARSGGVRLVGPNNIGIVNSSLGALCTFLTPMRVGESGAPPVGLVSQSGALGFALAQAVEHGVALSHVLTCGNSADVDVADYVAYLAEEPSCKAIACLFEGMPEPMRMIEACTLARSAGKAVIMFKIATGEQGAAAALSHTGSLAGANDAYTAAFEKSGAVVVDDYEDLLETAAFFAKAGRCTSPGVAVLSTSGGAAIMAADKAEIHGVPLPQPAPETTEVLLGLIPEFGSARNPCDVTAQVVSDPVPFRKAAGALVGDEAYGALVVPIPYAYEPVVSRVELLNDLARDMGKPVCIVWLPMWHEGPGSRTADAGDKVAMFRSMGNCFATLARWRRWSDAQTLLQVPAASATPRDLHAKTAGALTSTKGSVLSERPAKALLAAYGIPMIADVLTASVEAAIAAAKGHYPVVLKAESARIPHKTEAGVVRLSIGDEAALRIAYDEVMANALKVARPEDINGVLIQEMVPQGVEVIVGARIDPMFGPLVIVGLGGIMVELLRDSAVALAPVSEIEALGMLRRLKGFALLEGFRGSAPVDVNALAKIICRVGDFAHDHRELIAELDVNPLICSGDRIVGVDALIALKST